MKTCNDSTILYVSQTAGDDANTGYSRVADGSGAGPFRTLEQALTSIVSMRTSGLRQPMTVRIMGDYFMNEPLRMGCLDYPRYPKFNPDTPVENICFESDPLQSARVIGGKRIDGFAPDTLNGRACLSAEIPEARDGAWQFTDLYVNGSRATWAKYPAEGRLRAETSEFPHWEDTCTGSKWFIACKGDLDAIPDVEDCFVSFEHHWVDEHSPVAAFDRESRRVELTWRSGYNMSTDRPDHTSEFLYYLENTIVGFTEKGNWYLDRQAGKLYYIPRDGECAETLEVFAPTTAKLFQMRGTEENKVRGVRLRELELCCTAGDYYACYTSDDYPRTPGEHFYACDIQSCCGMDGAISFEFAEHCAVEHCKLHGIGYYAIKVKQGCSDIRITANRIIGIGAGGVNVFGGNAHEPVALRTTHITVSRNEIGDIGQRYAAGCGILIAHAAYNSIEENEIHDTYYSGISVGWVWGYDESVTHSNRICRNHIWNIGRKRLSDLGGIYCLGRQSGTLISENVIHDVTCSVYFAEGIHADEGSSLLTVERNIIYRTGMCICLHFGEYNTVRNNILAFADEQLIWGGAARESHTQMLCENNVLVQSGRPIFANVSQIGLRSSENLIWDTTGEPTLYLGENEEKHGLRDWQEHFDRDRDSIVADPHFADAANGDFRMTDPSAAESIGFAVWKK